MVRLLRVLPTIYFDDHFSLKTHETDNVWSNRLLPPKFVSGQLALTKMFT